MSHLFGIEEKLQKELHLKITEKTENKTAETCCQPKIISNTSLDIVLNLDQNGQ